MIGFAKLFLFRIEDVKNVLSLRKEYSQMSITRIFRGTAMDLEQERKFEQVLEQRCWRYFLPIGISIILFEIYNIIYALHYTDFRLDTRASRVYMVFLPDPSDGYCGGDRSEKCDIWKKGKRRKSRLCLRIYQVYGLILLFWAACVTVYDRGFPIT